MEKFGDRPSIRCEHTTSIVFSLRNHQNDIAVGDFESKNYTIIL